MIWFMAFKYHCFEDNICFWNFTTLGHATRDLLPTFISVVSLHAGKKAHNFFFSVSSARIWHELCKVSTFLSFWLSYAAAWLKRTNSWETLVTLTSQLEKRHLSGVVNRVAIWFYYRKAFATAFAVLSRAQFWLSRRDFFRNIFRGGFRGKYSS